MTKQRFLTLFLVLALALSLTVPAAAATTTVKVTGVTLDKTELTLAPGETAGLFPTILPANATNQKVTWESNQTAVVTVKDGIVTAKTPGTADVSAITVDGRYRAVCRVTVEDNYVTGLEITPRGPEILPPYKTRQLTATVLYAHYPQGSQDVIWSSSDPAVATVTPQGLVTTVAPGTAVIMAMSQNNSREGTPIFKQYELTVSNGEGGNNLEDVLFLDKTADTVRGGLYQTIVLNAPSASVVRDGTDVTSEYTLDWSWTNSEGAVLSTEQTASLSLVGQEDVTVTCNVTATCNTDSTKLPFKGSCVYTVQVLPGTVISAQLDVNRGVTPLSSLKDGDKGLSVVDQLLQGNGTQLTPAIAGLRSVTFDPDRATGSAGALNVAEETVYGVSDEAENKLGDVAFVPVEPGTYIIPFTAVGSETYMGQLEIVVTGTPDPVQTSDADLTCDSSGLTFSGTDFYTAEDTDPVASVTFGKPSAGQLLRDMTCGSGVADAGAKYYTNSVKDGDYHVSTLSYLPPAGFSGKISIPLSKTLASGQVVDGSLIVQVTHKTSSDTFTDVSPDTTGQWSSDAVDFAYDSGLVNGTGDSVFSPDATMTRAMLVTVLYRAAGSPAVTMTTNFTDLNPNSYYYNAVVWASAMGVVNGVTDRRFSPDTPVTREQIAVILYRYAALSGQTDGTESASLAAYTDQRQVGAYAQRAMGWAVSRGIITGTSAATLSPLDPATRAQVVVMLHRYLAE